MNRISALTRAFPERSEVPKISLAPPAGGHSKKMACYEAGGLHQDLSC